MFRLVVDGVIWNVPEYDPVIEFGSRPAPKRRFLWALAAAGVLACGSVPLPTLPDMAPLSGDPCAGWGCVKDTDCPPTLCIDATKHGRCESGVCSWR